MGLNCSSAFPGLPKSCFSGNGILMPAGIALTSLSQQFDTLADAGDDQNWIQDIIDEKISPVLGIKQTEDASSEDTFWEGASGEIVYLFDGKYRLKFSVYVTVDQHKALREFSGKSGRIYLFDKSNKIIGTSPDGAIFKGAKIGSIQVGKLMPSTDATPAFTVIDVQLENTVDWNEKLHVIDPGTAASAADQWYTNELPSLSTVTVTQVGTVSGNNLVVDVKLPTLSFSNADGDYMGNPAIEGLVLANFAATDGSSSVTPNTVTEDSAIAGRYTISFTTFTTGTIQVVPSTSQAFKSAVTTVS